MKRSFQQARRALGSQAILTVCQSEESQATLLLEKAWDEISTFEQRFSRFKTDSELSRLNASNGQPFTASPELIALLTKAIAFWKETGGIYDPSILPTLEEVGYSRNFEDLIDTFEEKATTPLTFPSLEEITIKGTTVYLPPGMRLDFGGIGKGYLLDQLVTLIQPDCQDFCFSLGGDLVISGTGPHGEPWKVGVQHPHQPLQDIAQFHPETDQLIAIATSGTWKRRGTHAGKKWHHLIDPRTHQPAVTDLRAVTVFGPSATTADIYASCCIILGAENVDTFMQSHPSYAALSFTEAPVPSPIWSGTQRYPILWL